MKELLVYKKAEVLLQNVYPIIRNFPNAEKYALALEVKQAFFRLLRNIVLANNIKSRRRLHQEEADAEIKLLLVLFSVAKNQKYISKGKHYELQVKLEEIGRMLGGWMKSS
ncbi:MULTISPECIES: diversity-generating retroelement protein Avd [Brevibacillus]|uniref:Four helix bundle protein n=1 Tax=Brevibacillus fulvus TaxID=1125967 RepID=A0A938XW06_9BACL|nr:MULTISPECIES: diversity-generating retroelement protein Avd [Brevibacillus]EJL45681.1 S23 ribosomal protein [Brevibacillus sp. CF112]MBM7591187.1 four helix bundle protein [Brevibacillus fulvus]